MVLIIFCLIKQIGLEGGDVSLSEIVSSSDTTDYDYAAFTELSLPDGNYTVSVTAVNGIQQQSQRKQAQVYVLTKQPLTTGNCIIILLNYNMTDFILRANFMRINAKAYKFYYRYFTCIFRQKHEGYGSRTNRPPLYDWKKEQIQQITKYQSKSTN